MRALRLPDRRASTPSTPTRPKRRTTRPSWRRGPSGGASPTSASPPAPRLVSSCSTSTAPTRKRGGLTRSSNDDRADGRRYLAQSTPGHGGGAHLPHLSRRRSGLSPARPAGHRADVDVRGEGGFVVVAPSNHLEGAYAWLDEDADPAPAPAWRADLIAEPPAPPAPPPPPRSSAAGYGAAALADELGRLAGTPAGGRNRATSAAYGLGRAGRRQQLGGAVVRAALASTAAAIGLRASEIDATIASGLDAGARSPRRALPPSTAAPRPPPPADRRPTTATGTVEPSSSTIDLSAVSPATSRRRSARPRPAARVRAGRAPRAGETRRAGPPVDRAADGRVAAPLRRPGGGVQLPEVHGRR